MAGESHIRSKFLFLICRHDTSRGFAVLSYAIRLSLLENYFHKRGGNNLAECMVASLVREIPYGGNNFQFRGSSRCFSAFPYQIAFFVRFFAPPEAYFALFRF